MEAKNGQLRHCSEVFRATDGGNREQPADGTADA